MTVQAGKVLPFGIYDLDQNGVNDTVSFLWNGRAALFISDDGKLPFEITDDWNAFFNEAFYAGEPRNPWNPVRSNWGNYTILVDRDQCGRYDSRDDFCYRAFDANGDGLPEAEYYHLFPGMNIAPWSNKLVCNFDGEPDMSYLDFENFTYANEQAYGKGFKYHMNVHGCGLFVNSYSAHPETSWETPIAWYDFDHDGRSEMAMRVGDVKNVENVFLLYDRSENGRYSGLASEVEMSFELNGDTSEERWHSLDLHMCFFNYENPGLDYTVYNDHLPFGKALSGSEPFYGEMASIRLCGDRQYLPYLDGPVIGVSYPDWSGVFMIFDEDNDDCRWEEMFSVHEGRSADEDAKLLADKIGDRTERDDDFGGKGHLYIGRFDGKIHLYHAEQGWWEIDYLALYKGSTDHPNATEEGPIPPEGLRYPRVIYKDTTGNGFFDTIIYSIVEYGHEDETEEVIKIINLLDYADEKMPNPDVCETFALPTDIPLTGFKMENWDGNPLPDDLMDKSSAKQYHQYLMNVYGKVCDAMWDSAQLLYQTAVRFGLNISEQEDQDLRTAYTIDERLNLKEIPVPKGYSRHLTAYDRRTKYDNGFWLREKVFADLCSCDMLDRFTLEKYYYTARYTELCRYIEQTLA